jgi:hypothetical protein
MKLIAYLAGTLIAACVTIDAATVQIINDTAQTIHWKVLPNKLGTGRKTIPPRTFVTFEIPDGRVFRFTCGAETYELLPPFKWTTIYAIQNSTGIVIFDFVQ